MNYKTIAEIYNANAKIRENLVSLVSKISEDQANFRIDEKTWTIAEVVEHIAIVENGMASICAKLLQKSAEIELPNNGTAHISEEFLQKAALISDRRNRKAEAPERVLPTGNLSIQESLNKMNETSAILGQIREGYETINTQTPKFPHPFFGDMSGTEWLALIGGHEVRHIDQIEEILSNQK